MSESGLGFNLSGTASGCCKRLGVTAVFESRSLTVWWYPGLGGGWKLGKSCRGFDERDVRRRRGCSSPWVRTR